MATAQIDHALAAVEMAERAVKAQMLDRACSQSFLGNLHVDANRIYIGSDAGKRALNELRWSGRIEVLKPTTQGKTNNG